MNWLPVEALTILSDCSFNINRWNYLFTTGVRYLGAAVASIRMFEPVTSVIFGIILHEQLTINSINWMFHYLSAITGLIVFNGSKLNNFK
ncbi:MAG: hypothetical protein ACLRQF_08410 [Thomasclavelia ramosa]